MSFDETVNSLRLCRAYKAYRYLSQFQICGFQKLDIFPVFPKFPELTFAVILDKILWEVRESHS